MFQSPGRDAIAKQTSPLINLTFPSQPALQLIYDTAPIGLAFLSPDCRYLQINRRLTEICGISVEDHLGRSVRECVPALAESVENIVQSIMETGEPVTGIEVAGQRADQTDERSWITYWHPLRGPTGEIVGVNVAAEEITERKRAEAELRASERQFHTLADSIPQLVWMAEAGGKVFWFNNLWHEYTVEEMGCRPSPLIEGSLLIVFTGARPGATVLALDKLTGKEVWKALDEHASNSSPIVISSSGRRQLIVWTDKSLASLDPANGRTFWRELMNTSNNDDVAAPVFWGNRLLVSGLMLELGGDPPSSKFLWPENRVPSRRILSNTSTPTAQGEYIYACRSPGELVCLEAATGRQIWSTNSVTTTKNGASINITPQGDGFFLFTDEGNLIRAQLSPAGYREISRSHLIDPTWPFDGKQFVYAPPAFANRHVFARNEAEVVCASLEK